MRVAVLAVIGAMAVAVAVFGVGSVRGQLAVPAAGPAAEPSGQLIALTAAAGQSHQQVTLIDPARRIMSVYHIELATGKISLKSVRNVHWDLQMEEFNTDGPSPREIRSLIQTR